MTRRGKRKVSSPSKNKVGDKELLNSPLNKISKKSDMATVATEEGETQTNENSQNTVVESSQELVSNKHLILYRIKVKLKICLTRKGERLRFCMRHCRKLDLFERNKL